MSDHILRSSHSLDHLTIRDVIDAAAGESSGNNRDEAVDEVFDATPHEEFEGNINTIDIAFHRETLQSVGEDGVLVHNLVEEVPAVNVVPQLEQLHVNEEVSATDVVVSHTTVQVPNTSVAVESNRQLQVVEEGSVDGTAKLVNLQVSIDNTGNHISNQDMSEVDKQRLVSIQESLRDDVTDYIEENPTEDLLFIDDVNSCINRIEELRSKYRSIHKDLRALDTNDYETTWKGAYEETLQEIKTFITAAKAVKNSIRGKQVDLIADEKRVKEAAEEADKDRKRKTKEFLLKDLERLLTGISNDIDVSKISDSRELLSDEALIAKRTNLPSIQKRIDSLSQKFMELLSVVPDAKGSSDEDVSKFADQYEKLQVCMIKYQDKLHEEIKSRELDKEKNFKSSNLQIKLPKFKGYDSVLDIYTFKDKYDKLHSSSTPKRMMAEHIKNVYLEGSASDFVKRIDDIDEIWTRLKKAFGDPRVMLTKKLSELESIGSLGKVHSAEKSKDALNKLVNVIHDLMKIAEVHKIEDKLYNGDSVFTIYKVMGDIKVTKFIETEKTYDQVLMGKELWNKLVQFLEKDIKIQLEKSMIYRTFEKDKISGNGKDVKDSQSHYSGSKDGGSKDNGGGNNERTSSEVVTSKKDQKTCFLCSKDDHVATKGPYGKKLIQYFSCEIFVQMSPGQRFEELKRKGLCYQCLFPGAKINTGKHVEGKCQNTYICKHDSHNTFTSKKHLLVCEEHKNDVANKTLLEEYRTRCITRNCNSNLPNFAKEIQLSFHCVYTSNPLPSPGEYDHDAIYMFQQIKVNGEIFMLFFDNGCGEIVMTLDAVQRLGSNAKQVFNGTVSLGGVGGVGVQSPYGAYEITLPLANGRKAVMSGLVIEQITNEFPSYVLDTTVQQDIVAEFVRRGGNPKDLPQLLNSIGGRVDVMIGVKYLRYFPKEVFMLLSGLTMYCSPFVSVDGSRGVVAGPHEMFSKTNNHFYVHNESTRHKSFFTEEAELSRMVKLDDVIVSSCCVARKNLNSFDEVEMPVARYLTDVLNAENAQVARVARKSK